MKKTLKKLTPLISIVFFGFALWFLNQELHQYELSEVTAQLSKIPNMYIVASLGLSALSYLLLTGYDALGIQYIGEDLETGKIVRAGYIGYAFSHNIGLALITGGSIRYRIYSAWGFTGMQVTQIVAFSAFTLWIGFCSVAGLSLLFATPDLPSDVTMPFISLRVLGIILLIMVVGYIWASSHFKNQISFKKWSFTFPDLKLSLKQVAIASVDWLLAASVLYVLLPKSEISFFSFVGVFLLAQIVGLFSQVPGGLGVFESVMLLYLTNFMPGPEVLSILVVYRLIYYIIPLLVALVVLGYQEYKVNRQKVEEFREKAANWVPRVVPQVMSVSVFLGGAILLFSGAMPSEVPRMQWLQHFIPLPVIEMSHFLASLIGAALLILAGALQRRSDGAYHLTIGLLVFGILFSLLKGADYEEASVLAIMLVAMVPCRNEFHRKASLVGQLFSLRWFILTLMVLGSVVWLGLFSYRNVEYQNELWWEFTLTGDAPRYLRAVVAAFGLAVLVGLVKLLHPRRKETTKPEDRELGLARKIIQDSKDAIANLVLTRDKELLFNEEHNSFIMFTREKNSWIALGDPQGPAEEAEETIWEFRDECESEGVIPAFYHVGNDYLEYYLDLGLTLFKLGEEARVPLQEHNLSETVDANVWSHHKQLTEEGYFFKVLPEGMAKRYLPELYSISEASLRHANRIERGFSVGFFDDEYLNNFPIALVMHEGNPVAFSNLLLGGNGYEVATDLFRYDPGAPEGIIDFVVLNTMQWAKEQGIQWFNLGMAPLAGMEAHEYSPNWSKFAGLMYSYGENFYGFKTVRAYKSQFSPQWEPKFLVAPGGMELTRALSNLTNVVSGGFSSLVSSK